MFCHKCGTQIEDGAAFCYKCGEKLIGDDMKQQAVASTHVEPMQQMQQQSQAVIVNTPKKKKSIKLLIGLGAAVLVVVAVVFIAVNWKGDVDYEATVRAYTPYDNSQGLPYTCGEVFDQYIENAEWNVRKSDKATYVDVSGIAKGTDRELVMTVQVEIEGDRATMKPVSAKLDGEESTEDIFFALFVARDEKDDDLSHLEELISEVDFALHGGELKGIYTDETTGISFCYPDWWVALDSHSEYEIVEIISPRNNANHITTFSVSTTPDPDPFGVFTEDETSIKNSLNSEYLTVLDFGDVMLGDIPAKALRYKTPGLSGDDIVVMFVYTVGENVYEVKFSYAENTSGVYDSIFQAIAESYTPGTDDIDYSMAAGNPYRNTELYLNAVGEINDIVSSYAIDYGVAQYVIYDLDKDGDEELIVSYGEIVADRMIDVYMFNPYSEESWDSWIYIGSFVGDCDLFVAEDGNGIYAVRGFQGVEWIYQITKEGDVIYEELISERELSESELDNNMYYSNDRPLRVVNYNT